MLEALLINAIIAIGTAGLLALIVKIFCMSIKYVYNRIKKMLEKRRGTKVILSMMNKTVEKIQNDKEIGTINLGELEGISKNAAILGTVDENGKVSDVDILESEHPELDDDTVERCIDEKGTDGLLMVTVA